MPRLADRSVVIKPVDPIYIPAGERGILVYKYTTLDCGFVDHLKEPLFDLPGNFTQRHLVFAQIIVWVKFAMLLLLMVVLN